MGGASYQSILSFLKNVTGKPKTIYILRPGGEADPLETLAQSNLAWLDVTDPMTGPMTDLMTDLMTDPMTDPKTNSMMTP